MGIEVKLANAQYFGIKSKLDEAGKEFSEQEIINILNANQIDVSVRKKFLSTNGPLDRKYIAEAGAFIHTYSFLPVPKKPGYYKVKHDERRV